MIHKDPQRIIFGTYTINKYPSTIQIFLGHNVYFHFQKLAHNLSIHYDRMPLMHTSNHPPLDSTINHETKKFLEIMAHLYPKTPHNKGTLPFVLCFNNIFLNTKPLDHHLIDPQKMECILYGNARVGATCVHCKMGMGVILNQPKD
jgi:hypothetical protein